MKSEQQELIKQLRRELGDSEETEQLIDWLLDSWTTLEMLRERFDEARALQLYIASVPSLLTSQEQKAVPT